jgi:hypothetical protein
MTTQLDVAKGKEIVARWCTLAERRLEHLIEMLESGRGRRYHSEGALLDNIQEARQALEAWRSLLSPEASRDNGIVGLSWLGRRKTAVPQGDMWCDPLLATKTTEIARDAREQGSVATEDDTVEAADVLSVQPAGDGVTARVPALTTIAQRYPLLRNAL